jgi:hypothetical protein
MMQFVGNADACSWLATLLRVVGFEHRGLVPAVVPAFGC